MSELHKFLFDGLPVRGSLVRLEHDWQEVLKRRSQLDEWPDSVTNILGEMAAASLLMQSNIKFNGALILQIQGQGALKIAVAEAQNNLSFRVTAKTIGDIDADATLQSLANQNDAGRCAITLDPKDKLPGQQAYQGVVSLSVDGMPDANLSQVLQQYMLMSEQIDSIFVLAANHKVAAGLLIQRIPGQGVNNIQGKSPQYEEVSSGNSDNTERPEDDFQLISILAASLTSHELLGVDSETILRRLFWQEHIVRFETLRPSFSCTCSRSRVEKMVQGLGKEEAEGLIEERGAIDVDCDFCGAHYRFDGIEVAELFMPKASQAPSTHVLQ